MRLIYPEDGEPSLADDIAAGRAVECPYCSDATENVDYWDPGAEYDSHVAECEASANLIERWAEG